MLSTADQVDSTRRWLLSRELTDPWHVIEPPNEMLRDREMGGVNCLEWGIIILAVDIIHSYTV